MSSKGIVAVVLGIWLGASATTNAAVELVSRAQGEPVLANGPNRGVNDPSISPDGRYIAFASGSSNLVAGDTTGFAVDILIYDRETKTRELLIPGANDGSSSPSISEGGRFVAFQSRADNLVSGDTTSDTLDIFVHDRVTGTTELLTSGGNDDSFDASISPDGRYVAFHTNANNLVSGDNNNNGDVFVYDRNTSMIENITAGGNASSTTPTISGNGQFVVFRSNANNLVSGDTNNRADVFLFDLQTSSLERLTFGNGDSGDPVISDDGRFVAFSSFANNLVSGDVNGRSDIFLLDRSTFVYTNLTTGGNLSTFGFGMAMSGDGQIVSFSSTASNLVTNDSNGATRDIFVYSVNSQTLELVTAGANSASFRTSLNADGQILTLDSFASNLDSGDRNEGPDLFVYNTTDTTLERILTFDTEYEVAGANETSGAPSVSEGGNFVAFQSRASNLVAAASNGRTGIFIYSRDSQANEWLTPDADGDSFNPSISADGNVVAFESNATNLVNGDVNVQTDVFVFDRESAIMQRLSPGGSASSVNPAISGDGRFVTFESDASNLVTGDNNGHTDIFLYNLSSGTTTLVSGGGNGNSREPAISGNGRFVAFASEADNLVAGDSTSNLFDVFVYDRTTGTTELVTSGGNSSSLKPSISEGGRFVAFESHASNLASGDSNGSIRDIFVYDRENGTTELVTLGTEVNTFGNASISGDGRLVVFSSTDGNLVAQDNNRTEDIFVFNRDTQVLESPTLALGADGDSSAASISPDGRAIAFSSLALTFANDGTVSLVDVFLSITNDPATADPLSVSTNEDTPVSFTVTGFDSESDVISFQTVSQPASGTLSGSAPNYTYTPNQDFSGLDSFTFSVSDGSGPSSPATVSINVAAVNDAPVGTGATQFTTPEDSPIAITLTGQDIDDDSIAYLITTQPTFGALFGTPPDLIYSPTDNFNGTDSFGYAVSDGALTSAEVVISLTVLPINDAPIASPQSVETSANTQLAITLFGADPDNDPLSFSLVGLPTNGTLSGALPNLTYSPAAGFLGVDSFTFTVSDGTTTSAVTSVAVTVSEATSPPITNTAPVADTQSLSTATQTPVAISLTGSDIDGDTLQFSLISLPANGSLTGSAPDLIYTPDANFTGADSFVFSVADGQATSAPATVSVTVTEATVQLFSAILPASRSVEVGATATAFATLINAGTTEAQSCALQLPEDIAADFFYQASDSTTNLVVGEQNTPINIPPGGSQSFVFGITPTEEMAATQVAVVFRCANASDASSFAGLNTLLLSASATPVADLIALAATTSTNGVMELSENSGFFTSATINVGSDASITVSADTGAAVLPLALSLCQTDPLTSVCINPTQPGIEPVFVSIAAGESPTFAVFATASESIALDPANSRVFLNFSDERGELRGATSVAVQNSP